MIADTNQLRRPIIALASNAWHGNWMNRQHILSRLAARGWPVVYSTGALSVSDYGTQDWSDAPWRWHEKICDGVRVVTPHKILPRWHRYQTWDNLALHVHAHGLRCMIKEYDPDRAIAILFEPRYFPYLEYLRPHRVVFHIRDAYDRIPGFSARSQREFSALQSHADLITVASRMFLPLLDNEARKKARELLNGGDVEAVRNGLKSPCPEDLAMIPRPRIAYVGVISLKVDIDLIDALADLRADWHWVFIGPTTGHTLSDDFAERWQKLLARSNVHYLGARKHTEVPSYIAHVDVHVMPYVTDERAGGWARFAYPLKLHECLATGLPVISARLPELYAHKDVLEVVDGYEAWVGALERALSGHAPGNASARQRVAEAHSWDSRVDQLEHWLFELGERPSMPT